MTDQYIDSLIAEACEKSMHSDDYGRMVALVKVGYREAMEEAKEHLRIKMLDPYLDGSEIIAGHRDWLDAQVKKEGA